MERDFPMSGSRRLADILYGAQSSPAAGPEDETHDEPDLLLFTHSEIMQGSGTSEAASQGTTDEEESTRRHREELEVDKTLNDGEDLLGGTGDPSPTDETSAPPVLPIRFLTAGRAHPISREGSRDFIPRTSPDARPLGMRPPYPSASPLTRAPLSRPITQRYVPPRSYDPAPSPPRRITVVHRKGMA